MPGYTLADGSTLKNKLGLTDPDQLGQLEAEFVAGRNAEIEVEASAVGDFDAEHLKAIHRRLFQDVYEWAGHTRDERVAMSDGTIATEPILSKAEGQPFLVGPAIPAALDDIGLKLREANNLRGLSREEFAERAADVMIQLNDAHPFREGNGRTQRAFMRELAKEAGHNLDFSVISQERMIQASIAAHEQGDPSMMRRMFDEISDPPRTALLRDSIAKLEQQKFDWNDKYIATLAPGHSMDLVFAGTAGDQFMARTQTEILFGKVTDLPEPHPDRGAMFTVTATPYAQREEDTSRNARDNTAESVTVPLEDGVSAVANAATAGIARLAEGVAGVAERAIDAVADSLASLLGGGSSAPAPQHEAPPKIAPQTQADRVKAFLEAEQQQRAAARQEIARSLGAGEAISEDELQRQQAEEQKNGRDRGGGISR